MTQVLTKKNAGKELPVAQSTLLNRGPDFPENDEIAAMMVKLKLEVGQDKIDGSVLMPRYGLLSLKMRNTPIYAYDHPALKKIATTAFTDGVHIFVCSDFLKQLNKEEFESKGMEQGVIPLILHELTHMLMNHTRRLKQFPRDIANQAEDLSINAKLQLGFPEIKWVPSLREIGLSFKQGDIERYAKLAEETIARELMEKRSKKQDQKPGQGKGQSGSGQGKGQPGGPGQPGQGGQGEGEGGDDEKTPDELAINHTVPLEELIKILEENNLQGVMEKLELPQSEDLDSIGEIETKVRLKDIDAIQKAAAQKAQMGGKYPGGHIVDAASEMVKGFTEGKLVWRLGLKSFLFGDGMRFRYNESEPNDIYYVDPADMGLTTEIYIGQDMPHKPEEVVLVLIDTSGSVDSGQLKAFFSEIFNLKLENAGTGDTASEVIVISADTVVRGDAIEITENNVDELMNNGIGVFGRGGTDLGNDLRQTMALPLFKDKKISSVVFFTDLCDTPPKKSDFPSHLPLAFITCSQTMNEEFARQVKDFARVYPIEEGIEVNLDQDHLETPVNTRSTKM